jgi:hypothetical protein
MAKMIGRWRLPAIAISRIVSIARVFIALIASALRLTTVSNPSVLPSRWRR